VRGWEGVEFNAFIPRFRSAQPIARRQHRRGGTKTRKRLLNLSMANPRHNAEAILNRFEMLFEARSGTVGWGTALHARSSRVRFRMLLLEFFIVIILPVALWTLGLTQPLTEMSTRNISWGVKAAGAYGWQPYQLHLPIFLKSGRQPSEIFRARPGL
jgi:hypothetical protein